MINEYSAKVKGVKDIQESKDIAVEPEKIKPLFTNEPNIFKDLMNITLTVLMSVCIPLSIFSLVMSNSILKTFFHSLLLMHFTSVLTIKAFGWRIRMGSTE